MLNNPKEFAEFPAANPAAEVHLEEPVLGVQETQGARGIEPVGGMNRRNAEAIAFNLHRGVEARQRATPINLGQARMQRPPAHSARQHQQESQSAKQHTAPSPYPSEFHTRTVSQHGEGTTKGRESIAGGERARKAADRSAEFDDLAPGLKLRDDTRS